MGKFKCPLPIVRNNFYTWDDSHLHAKKKPPIIFVGTKDTPKEFPKEDFLDVVAAHEYSHYLLGHTDYYGNTEAMMEQKESDCWFHVLLKAEEWHINPVIAHWLIAHVERKCNWGGLTLSVVGKNAYILPGATMIGTSNTTMSEIYQVWRLRLPDFGPLGIAKTITIRLWRQFDSHGKVFLRHRAVRSIWSFLLASLSQAKPLTTSCVTKVGITLKSFPVSYLTDHIVSAAARMARRLRRPTIQFSSNTVAALVMWSTVMRQLHRPVLVTRCLLSPAGFKPRTTAPILGWCKPGCKVIRQTMTILCGRYQLFIASACETSLRTGRRLFSFVKW
jgi:hypothetical protein